MIGIGIIVLLAGLKFMPASWSMDWWFVIVGCTLINVHAGFFPRRKEQK